MWLEISVILIWLIIIGIIVLIVVLYYKGDSIGGTKSIITFNPGGNYINNNYQFFGSQNANEQVARIVMPQNAILSNLVVRNQNIAGQGQVRSYAVLVNSVRSLLAVEMTNDDLMLANTTTTIPVNAGDYVSVFYTDSFQPSTTGSISFVVTLI